jgi:hypothetical protein
MVLTNADGSSNGVKECRRVSDSIRDSAEGAEYQRRIQRRLLWWAIYISVEARSVVTLACEGGDISASGTGGCSFRHEKGEKSDRMGWIRR